MQNKSTHTLLLSLLLSILSSLSIADQVPETQNDALAPNDINPILDLNFEALPSGRLNEELVRKEFPKLIWATLEGRANIVDNHGKMLEVSYPKGTFGANDNGAQFLLDLPKSRELWLSYDLKFQEGFDFKRGGKLPGLTSSGSDYTGGVIPKEGEGWSARFMWRKYGRAVLYLYHIDMCSKWGEKVSLDNRSFEPGRWYNIVQHIKLNNKNRSDGQVTVWLNQDKVLTRKNLRLQTADSGFIDSFYFSTFHGGGNKDWAPQNTSFAQFDNILVAKNPPTNLPLRSPAASVITNIECNATPKNKGQ